MISPWELRKSNLNYHQILQAECTQHISPGRRDGANLLLEQTELFGVSVRQSLMCYQQICLQEEALKLLHPINQQKTP